jgi:hypothetical protein
MTSHGDPTPRAHEPPPPTSSSAWRRRRGRAGTTVPETEHPRLHAGQARYYTNQRPPAPSPSASPTPPARLPREQPGRRTSAGVESSSRDPISLNGNVPHPVPIPVWFPRFFHILGIRDSLTGLVLAIRYRSGGVERRAHSPPPIEACWTHRPKLTSMLLDWPLSFRRVALHGVSSLEWTLGGGEAVSKYRDLGQSASCRAIWWCIVRHRSALY